MSVSITVCRYMLGGKPIYEEDCKRIGSGELTADELMRAYFNEDNAPFLPKWPGQVSPKQKWPGQQHEWQQWPGQQHRWQKWPGQHHRWQKYPAQLYEWQEWPGQRQKNERAPDPAPKFNDPPPPPPVPEIPAWTAEEMEDATIRYQAEMQETRRACHAIVDLIRTQRLLQPELKPFTPDMPTPGTQLPPPSASAPPDDKNTDAKVCSVCLENEAVVANMPCGHVVSCVTCVRKMGINAEPRYLLCPLCRKPVTTALRIFK